MILSDPTAAGPAAPGLTDGFWAAAGRGVLVRPVCDACGRSFFTPRVLCPFCLSASWHYVESSGCGTVYSHTTVHRGPDRTWEVPFVLGIVDVEEGWSLLTRLLVPPPPDEPAGALIGLPVVVTFVDAHPPSSRRLPAFSLREPAHTSAADSSNASGGLGATSPGHPDAKEAGG